MGLEQNKSPEISKHAIKYLKSLDKKQRERLLLAISKIPFGNIKPLLGTSSFRLRVGDLRIIYEWLNEEQIIISYIGSRGDVYKKGF